MKDSYFHPNFFIKCRGKLIDLSTPKVMGIINVTPDSFYDGGKNNTIDTAIRSADRYLNEGATFIDVGGYSSRPRSKNIDENTELERVTPIIEALIKEFPDILISIDTFRSKVADICIEAGASIINDISAGNLDENMINTLIKHKVPYILMHMRGNPQTMQDKTNYMNLCKDMILFFSEKISSLRSRGIHDLIIDPGFGFSKTMTQNFELLNSLEFFQLFNIPILSGISRKSMVFKSLNVNILDSINGTTALHVNALQNGCKILRVHDVIEAIECIKLHQLTIA